MKYMNCYIEIGTIKHASKEQTPNQINQELLDDIISETGVRINNKELLVPLRHCKLIVLFSPIALCSQQTPTTCVFTPGTVDDSGKQISLLPSFLLLLWYAHQEGFKQLSY